MGELIDDLKWGISRYRPKVKGVVIIAVLLVATAVAVAPAVEFAVNIAFAADVRFWR